ncbi:hypothetical protein COLO4_25524 [Corchorus olitorius]|uniref:Uncharacterized protein n=1 Tax=Corchorus olitorius TaxID=93759 RepID=A0A1R3I200_9ROSI|nr:hypothetical protein COLO4_25524 [Corchorus olitorius]
MSEVVDSLTRLIPKMGMAKSKDINGTHRRPPGEIFPFNLMLQGFPNPFPFVHLVNLTLAVTEIETFLTSDLSM